MSPNFLKATLSKKTVGVTGFAWGSNLRELIRQRLPPRRKMPEVSQAEVSVDSTPF